MNALLTVDFNSAAMLIVLAIAIVLVIADVFLIELPAKRGQFMAPSRDYVVFPALAAMAVGYGAFQLRYVLFRAKQPMLDYWVLGIYVATIAVIAVHQLFALRRMCLMGC